MRVVAVLFLALGVLAAVAWARTPEYDESYSIFLTAGDARPAWPQGVFSPGEMRGHYAGSASFAQIDHDLRLGDVHPPLYFWLLEIWRRLFGPAWFTARLLSVLLATAGLAALAWLAALLEIPASRTVLLALLSYGFAYTGIVIRGFALAELFNILGMALVLAATRSRHRGFRLGLVAGLAFGGAGCSNYLAVFVGLAAFFWLLADRFRRRVLPATLLGFAIFLPFMLSFFLAQKNSRLGQFQAFSPGPAGRLLAKDFAAAWLGGLPVYAGRAGPLISAALAILAGVCAFHLVGRWRKTLALPALATVFVPAGLLALGAIFGNLPVEIRYLAFAMPFLALLLAATLPAWPRRLLLTVQALGILGLAFAPATMQKQAIAARQLSRLALPHDAMLVLLPFGNDGVGIPGPFVITAPADLRLRLIRPGSEPELGQARYVALAMLRADAASTSAVSQALAELDKNPCLAQQASTAVLRIFAMTCPPKSAPNENIAAPKQEF